jgi:hypothetical protein
MWGRLCQPPKSEATRPSAKRPGSTGVPPVGFGVSPKRSFQGCESETLPPTGVTPVLPSSPLISALLIPQWGSAFCSMSRVKLTKFALIRSIPFRSSATLADLTIYPPASHHGVFYPLLRRLPPPHRLPSAAGRLRLHNRPSSAPPSAAAFSFSVVSFSPCSLLPAPCSQLPAPCSLLLACSLLFRGNANCDIVADPWLSPRPLPLFQAKPLTRNDNRARPGSF